ncbi:Mini-ribonuclease 3 [Mycoplasma sp. P36-A1]|uniref:Mini-ribonuclease 3 n=1 Tax=Mycoplasma sp. P36-A1 TaxID=3252900 RepID=UPI003C308D36
MNYPSLTLAFIGDSVLELIIRMHYVNKGIVKVNKLQTLTSSLASAKAHKEIMDYLFENEILTEDEIRVYKRGRNAKVNQRRKNFNSENYHASTGFEALIGFLYLNEEHDRIEEIVKIIIERFDK